MPSEAENIQGQSLTVLDDARLKSAVSDAEAKLKTGN
jgi:multidrug resistance efflux pump